MRIHPSECTKSRNAFAKSKTVTLHLLTIGFEQEIPCQQQQHKSCFHQRWKEASWSVANRNSVLSYSTVTTLKSLSEQRSCYNWHVMSSLSPLSGGVLPVPWSGWQSTLGILLLRRSATAGGELQRSFGSRPQIGGKGWLNWKWQIGI